MMEETQPVNGHYPNEGDCLWHARLIREALRTVGIDSTAGGVYPSLDDRNAWEQQEEHQCQHDPPHRIWTGELAQEFLVFNGGDFGYNLFEGCLKLEEGGTWYYFAATPDLDATHSTDAGASIWMIRVICAIFPGCNQEWWFEDGTGQSQPTGYTEALPDPP